MCTNMKSNCARHSYENASMMYMNENLWIVEITALENLKFHIINNRIDWIITDVY